MSEHRCRGWRSYERGWCHWYFIAVSVGFFTLHWYYVYLIQPLNSYRRAQCLSAQSGPSLKLVLYVWSISIAEIHYSESLVNLRSNCELFRFGRRRSRIFHLRAGPWEAMSPVCSISQNHHLKLQKVLLSSWRVLTNILCSKSYYYCRSVAVPMCTYRVAAQAAGTSFKWWLMISLPGCLKPPCPAPGGAGGPLSPSHSEILNLQETKMMHRLRSKIPLQLSSTQCYATFK